MYLCRWDMIPKHLPRWVLVDCTAVQIPLLNYLLLLKVFQIYFWIHARIMIICHSSVYIGQEMLTRFGTPDFTPFGEFMISPIHYSYWIWQFWDYVYRSMTLVCLPGLVWLLCRWLILLYLHISHAALATEICLFVVIICQKLQAIWSYTWYK